MSQGTCSTRRGPGRPGLGDRVNFSVALPGELRDWIDAQAAREEVKASALARRLMEEYRQLVERSRGPGSDTPAASPEAAPRCPHCRGDMLPARVFSRVKLSPAHNELLYSLTARGKSVWTGGFPVDGSVAARLCERCGHIALFGRNDTIDDA